MEFRPDHAVESPAGQTRRSRSVVSAAISRQPLPDRRVGGNGAHVVFALWLCLGMIFWGSWLGFKING